MGPIPEPSDLKCHPRVDHRGRHHHLDPAAHSHSKTLPASLIAIGAVTLVVWLVHAQLPPWALSRITCQALPPRSQPGTVQALFGSSLAVAVLLQRSKACCQQGRGRHDRLHPKPNRELFGQGLANIGSGMFGECQTTGAIARSAVNVRAGATSRLSAITHSVVLLLIMLTAASLVATIPLAALGASFW